MHPLVFSVKERKIKVLIATKSMQCNICKAKSHYRYATLHGGVSDETKKRIAGFGFERVNGFP